MHERVDELIETLESLLVDLADAGCHFVVSILHPNLVDYHYWRSRNVLVAYGLAELASSETHSALTSQD